MANHAKANFVRAVDPAVVAFYFNFISERDFGNAITCREEAGCLTFESSLKSQYWEDFAQQMVLFMENQNKTVELRHQIGANNTMSWARNWLHSASAAAFGAKHFSDEGVGSMSFQMFNKKDTSSAPLFSNMLVPKWLKVLMPSDIPKEEMTPAIEQSRLSKKTAPQLSRISDGFIQWALSHQDYLDMPRFDLAHIAITDSTTVIPENWLQGFNDKQYLSLYLHSVRNANIQAQQIIGFKLREYPDVETVRTFLKKLPEIKHSDVPHDVFDRKQWIKTLQLNLRNPEGYGVLKQALEAKRVEYVEKLVDLMLVAQTNPQINQYG